MLRQARVRAAARRAGLDPRYLRRARWLAKARALRSVGAPLRPHLAFVLLDPEASNFTYELDNSEELAAWVAAAARVSGARAAEAVCDVQRDAELSRRLHEATRGRWLWSKPLPPFGKRAGWYALARLLAPRRIVETGVHDGLGSLLLLRALERNASEGRGGRLVSFDVNPAAGWVVGSHRDWERRIQPSRAGLASVLAAEPVGLFIHDSLHSYENERFELRAAAARMAPGGVLVSDNAHGTTAFADTCAERGLSSAVFCERPRDHPYPGGAMGAAWRK